MRFKGGEGLETMRMVNGVALVAAMAAGAALSGCDKKAETAGASSTAAPASNPVGAVFRSGPPETTSANAGAVLARGLAANGKAEAQVVEATRQGGVLTVRVRFLRTPGSNGWETIYGGNPDKDAIYVVAGANKVFPLMDADNRPLVTPDLMLKVTTSDPVAGVWFGKFPAPPPEVKTVSLVLPKTEPLDNIAVADR